MRRGSVVGPLILILIGGLFLMNNLRPDLPVLDLLARYWPFLLIGWGILRLMEVVTWAATGRQLPERGVSGGEWALIVLLSLAGSGMFFFHRNVGPFQRQTIRSVFIGDFGEAFDYQISERKVACGKAPRVLIENFRGNARITGVDVDEVKVSGRKTVRAFQQKDADEAERLTPMDVVVQGDMIVIRTNQDRAGSDRKVTADLDITVPKGASVEGRGRLGDFDITDLAGAIEINSDNAGVRAQNIGGLVRIETRRSDVIRAINVKGPVELKGRGENVELENIEGQVTVNGAYFGEMSFRNLARPLRYEGTQTEFRVEKTPGEIRLARGYLNASNLTGPVVLTSKSKDVQINGFTDSMEISLERGDVELRPGKLPVPKMEVKTRNGTIDLALPDGAKFDLRATVQKGDCRTITALRCTLRPKVAVDRSGAPVVKVPRLC